MLSAYIRSLPSTGEFWIVVIAAFALPLANSQMALLDPASYEASDLRAMIVKEAVVLLALGWFLSIRGWDFAGLAAYPSWRDALVGVIFSIMFMQAWSVAWQGLRPIVPQFLLVDSADFTLGLDWPTVLAASVINPIYEELLVCGYVISKLSERHGLGFAIGSSVFVRCAYHTYQGLEGVSAMMLGGILFGVWFARTGRLWPVIVAHAMMDFFPLVRFTWV